MTPEVNIKAVLEAGFAALRADQTPVDDLFPDYSAEMRTYIKTWFAGNTPFVTHGWPRPDIQLPAVCIILGGADEAIPMDALGDYLGNDFTTEVNGEPTQSQETYGFADNLTFNLLVLSKDDVLTVYLWQVVRRILFLAKMTLESAGFLNMKFSGSDVRFEQDYFPEFVYSRQVTVAGSTYFMAKEAPAALIKAITSVVNVVVRT